MNKTNYEEFLDIFRQIESNLKDVPNLPSDEQRGGKSLFQCYEESDYVDDKEKIKLRMCRIIRNYCVHEQDYENFISINHGMIDFMKSELIKIQSLYLKVNDIMTPFKKMIYVTTDNTLFQAVELMDKKKIDEIPVIDKSNILVGFFTKENLYSVISCEIKLTLKFSKYTNLKKWKSYIKPTSNYHEVLGKGITIVTENGKSTGTVLGIII